MKTLILIALVCCYFVSNGQKTDSFRLSGAVNIDNGTIQLAEVGNAGDYPKDFNFAAVPSSDTSAADIALWKYIIKSNSLNWVQYRTTKTTMNNLHIFLAPWNFLLDNEGRILGRDMDTKEIASFLKTKLN